MTKNIYIILALLTSILFSSCDSFLDIQPVGKVIPNTLAEYRALMTTAYKTNQFQDKAYSEMRTDEIVISSDRNDQSSFSAIETWNDLNSPSGTATFGWSNYYNAIFYANSIIDKKDQITEGSKEDIEQLVGEAYLFRSYLHFILVNLYGQPYTKDGAPETKAIPLKLSVDLEEVPSRNTVKEVYTSILSDIQTARGLIHQKEWESKYLYRFSVPSIDAFEARVRLYMGEWQKAYEMAEQALAQKSTLEDMNGEMLPNNFESTEMITAYEFMFSVSSNKACLVSPSFLQKYDNTDLRLTKYFTAPDEENNRISAKGGEAKFTCTFRTGELYLNSAEAAARLDKLPEARARLLQLMEKRYTPIGYDNKKNTVNAMSQTELINEILEERARELIFEGHRWFDLRRTTRPRIQKELGGSIYVLEQDDARYTLRIPQEAIDANPGLMN